MVELADNAPLLIKLLAVVLDGAVVSVFGVMFVPISLPHPIRKVRYKIPI